MYDILNILKAINLIAILLEKAKHTLFNISIVFMWATKNKIILLYNFILLKN